MKGPLVIWTAALVFGIAPWDVLLVVGLALQAQHLFKLPVNVVKPRRNRLDPLDHHRVTDDQGMVL